MVQATEHADADVRLAALLTLKRAKHPQGEPIARRLLKDPDPRVRRMALVWIGSAGMLALRDELESAITTGTAIPELFETYIATVEQLSPEFVQSYRGETERYAKDLDRSLPPDFLPALVEDRRRPVTLRAIALRQLAEADARPEVLVRLARGVDAPALRLEAIRSLASLSDPRAASALLEVARDRSAPAELRAEALLGLSRQSVDASADALVLLDDPDADVRLEAARYLRTRTLPDTARASIARVLEAVRSVDHDEAVAAQLAMVLGLPEASRPSSLEGWQEAVARGGSTQRGRRVFFSVPAACSQCHMAEERGGELGPDLTGAGQSKSRDQLVRSIVRPSEEVAPEWQGWYVTTTSGRTHYGRQIDIGGDAVDLFTAANRFVTIWNAESYGPVDRSLMPDGLEENLTVADFRDLVAFLRREP